MTDKDKMLDIMEGRGIERNQAKDALESIALRLGKPEDLWTTLKSISLGVEDLSRRDRSDVVAGIFGTYQLTRASVLIDGISAND